MSALMMCKLTGSRIFKVSLTDRVNHIRNVRLWQTRGCNQKVGVRVVLKSFSSSIEANSGSGSPLKEIIVICEHSV